MNRIVALLATAIASTLATGCVVSIGAHEKPQKPKESTRPSPVVVIPGDPADTATLAEIDAIARLAFDDGKRDGFKAVATRPGTSPGVQVHLVNTLLRSLSFDNTKVEVLLALIENPGFSEAAKESIFRQLDHLSFDSGRTKIISAIQERTGTAPQ
ncbi:MAG: hypothetical protein AB7O66_24575 [Limisphaerales bacterium]